eukprot:CAMPEP_0117519290 /NCGR_PEP_ID=MMETSP0784-20121206/32573_1 /TAXON_ID=39447 /ORGANISM="" /LENGTH=153 /DNA_ID=CAMNT_0005315241 /DNA_START=50 /DNA_END=509 /DNA_ORIENTATION=+
MSGLPRVGPEQQQRYQPRLNNEHLWTMPEVLIDIEPHSVTRSVRAHFSLRFVDGGAPPQASSPDIDAEVIEYVEISAPDAPSSTLQRRMGLQVPRPRPWALAHQIFSILGSPDHILLQCRPPWRLAYPRAGGLECALRPDESGEGFNFRLLKP